MKIHSYCFYILFLLSVFALTLGIIWSYLSLSLVMEWSVMTSHHHMNFPIILDSISLLYGSAVMMISANVLSFSKNYMHGDPNIDRFTWMVILFVLSMMALIFVPHIMMLLLGWDGLGITSFALVIYYQNHKSLAAGMITIMMNRVGDACILTSIAILSLTQNWTLWSPNYVPVLGLLLTVAAMTKSAQIPFSPWLPAAMAAPTPVSALVHSSTLVTAGVYLLIRLNHMIAQSQIISISLLCMSTLTMIMSGLGALIETDMKKVIALSTLSQLGIMMTSLSINLPQLALFHMMTHAMFKALLFMTAGTLISSNAHFQDIRSFGMLLSSSPITASSAIISLLALSGIPFLAGFYSKDLIMETMMSMNYSIIMVFNLLGLGLTVGYSARMALMLFWSQNLSYSFSVKVDENLNSIIPMFLMSSFSVILGASAQWLLPTINHPNMPHLLTTVPLIIVSLSAATSFFVMNSLKSPINTNFMFLLSSMWFLTPLSTTPTTQPCMTISSSSIKLIELGWTESTILGTLETMIKKSSSTMILSTYLNPTNMLLIMALPTFWIATKMF